MSFEDAWKKAQEDIRPILQELAQAAYLAGRDELPDGQTHHISYNHDEGLGLERALWTESRTVGSKWRQELSYGVFSDGEEPTFLGMSPSK